MEHQGEPSKNSSLQPIQRKAPRLLQIFRESPQPFQRVSPGFAKPLEPPTSPKRPPRDQKSIKTQTNLLQNRLKFIKCELILVPKFDRNLLKLRTLLFFVQTTTFCFCDVWVPKVRFCCYLRHFVRVRTSAQTARPEPRQSSKLCSTVSNY